MVESSRLYRRKSVTIPVMFTPDDLPPIASHTEALPMTPFGTIERASYGANTKNTSEEGFCLVTEKKLDPGTKIDVRMVDFRPIPMGFENMQECPAKVVWCNPVGRTESGKCYEVGAIRIRKIDLPILDLKSHHFASLKCM